MKNRNLNRVFKMSLVLLGFILSTTAVRAQLTGIKTIPADYATIAAFVTDLNTQGVGSGGVTLNVPAGYTETAPAGGFSITASGTAANPIIIQGGVSPAPIITASAALVAGNFNDALFKIMGGDYITISGLELRENAANTTTAAATNNMTEWGIALLYATVTDGSQNVTLSGNTIVLNRTYQNTFGIYANATHAVGTPTTSATATGTLGGNSGLKIYANAISNVNLGILVVGPTASADHNDGIDIGGSSAATGNTITNFGTTATFTSYANVSGTVFGILVRNSRNLNVSYNTVTSSVGGTTAGTLRGIFIPSYNNASAVAQTNNITYNSVSVQSAVAGGTIEGITYQGTTVSATSTVNITNNNFLNIGHTVAASGTINFINATPPALVLSISNNTFSALSVNTTGTVTFISHSFSMPAGGTTNINANSIVTSFAKTGAGGTVFLTSTNGSSPTGSFANYLNNNFSNITVTGATTITGFNNTDGAGSSPTKIITGNTLNNWTGGTSGITCMNVTYVAGASSLSSNTITSITGQGSITGISIGSSFSGANPLLVSSNTISGLSSTGAGGAVTGITCSNTSALIKISNNTIQTLSSTGASLVAGINITGAAVTNVFANKIYGLASNNAGGTVFGIQLTGGTAVSAYNNLIGALTAPTANGTDVIRGISVSSSSTSTGYGIYDNTIYLNASSSGTNFGTSGIFHAANATSTTAALDMRNNIVINESSANGTGITVAFRRSAVALNNYAATSNRNLLYAGTPSATHLVMYDGTTSYQTLLSYQAVVAPRDVNSFTGEAFTYGTPGSFFISLTGSSVDFLRPVAGIVTQAESGGSNIGSPSITDDYAAVIRAGNAGYAGTGSAPDVGAYEFEGTTPAPVIVLNSVTPPATTQCVATARLVSVNITTASGTITGANLVYTVNGTAQTPIAMTNASGSTWTATIPAATPTNAVIAWAVTATNTLGLNSSYTGTPYSDDPLLGVTATASNTVSPVCAGTPSALSVVLSGATPPAYTAPPAVLNPTTDEDLGNITITQGATTILNNTTARNSLTGTIGTASGTSGSYSDFTGFGPYNMTAGQTYNFSLTALQDVTAYANAVAMYIDYNRNGIFSDAGEKVYASAATTSGGHTETGSFTIPASAFNGMTRMRLIVLEGSVVPSPTVTVGYGEYEEYLLNITSTNNGGGTIPAITSVSWSDGTTTVGTGNPLTINPTATQTYTATVTALGCTVVSSGTTVAVTALPSAPTATNSAQCGTQVPAASVTSTTGAPTPTFHWYDAAAAGTLMQSSTSTTYTSNVAASTTFYVSEVNGTTGCESPRTAVTITVATADGVVAATSAATICIGGSVTLTATNTNPTPNQSYTYSWSSAAGSGAATPVAGASVLITPTTPGAYTYNLAAVDGGCNAVATVAVTVNPFVATVTAVDATCNGVANGTFTLASSSCGTTPYVYSVDGGAFGPIPTNLAAGSHTVVAQDANLFQAASQSITIGQPSTTITNPTGTNAAVCQNAASAMVSGSASVNNPPGSVAVAFTVAGQPTETNAAPGNTVSSATYAALPVGATVTSATLTYNGLVALGSSWMSDVRLGLSGVITDAAASGTGSANSAGTFNYTRAIPAASISAAGGTVNLLYWDYVSDNSGVEATFPTGAGVATLTINYTVAPSPATLSWWDAASGGTQVGTGSPFETVGTPVLPTTATAGTYTFYAQGQNGACPSPGRTAVTVTVNALPVVNAGLDQTVCAGTPVTLSGSGATTYAWNNSVTNGAAFTPAATNTYTVTGTDGNGCQNTDVVAVNVNALPTVNAGLDQTVCIGTPVTLTATGTATGYAWNNSVTDGVAFTPSATMTYTVTGTDGNGCQKTDQVVVTVNALPLVGAGTDQATCTSGAVTLSGSGATSYTWDNSVTNGVAFTPATTATYTVTGTDGNGCQNTDQVVVTVNPLPIVGAGSDQIVCQGTAVTLSGSGATSYAWDNSVSDGVAFNAATTTTYTVTGTDGNGCQNTDQVTITVNTAPVVNAGTDQAVCPGTAVTLTASGTAAGYTWDNGITNGTAFTPTVTTTYTLTGSDAIGCQSTDQVTVTVNTLPSVDAGLDQSVCSGGTVTLSGAGATSYTWDNSVTDGVAFTPAATATYTVTGTDANGCQNTDAVTVTVNPLPTVGAGSDQTVCAGTMVTFSGSGATSYAWNNGVTDGVAFAATATNTYTVTGTDANGCQNTDQLTLTVNATPTAVATDNGDNTMTASAATSYQWIHCATGLPLAGATTQTYTATVNGTYAVVVTNASGCSDTSNCVTINNIGLNELTDASIHVFPNPTNSDVTITMSATKATIKVLDAQGKLLQDQTVVNGEKVNLSTYETGVYFLHIQTENGSAIERVVKN